MLQVHQKIRENPVLAKKARTKPADGKRWKEPKSSYETKKANLKAKLAALMEDDE
jgi:large subunit ribosomal protein L5e